MRALVLAAALTLAPPALAQDPTVDILPDDPALVAAKADARETLPLFFDNVLNDNGMAMGGAHLKVAFPVQSPSHEVEAIWVGPFQRDGDNFVGALGNEPVMMPGLSAGDTVTFTVDMIQDWGWPGPDGLLYGHYTTRVVASVLPEADAAAIFQLLPDDPIPAAWR